MNLCGKVALVTGAGRGIGRAVAIELAASGAKVGVTDISLSSAQSVADEIKNQGGTGFALETDVSRVADVSRSVDETVMMHERIDILVNNAGITRDRILIRMTDEEWDDVLAVNLKGIFLCTRAVLKHMLGERTGRIINIASIVGRTGNTGQSNYAAAKAGITGFTRSVAKEVAASGITVNAVAPGFIDTGMTANLNQKQHHAILERIPLGYMGAPQDIAAVVSFLVSDGARYITGQVITVDGGLGITL